MKLKEIVGYLRERNKLSLGNVRTGQEIWHVFVSRINMVLAAVALLLIVFVASLTTVAYTPVLDLIPGYPGSRSREALIAGIMKLDSLSAEVRRWEEYHADFAKILDGQVPVPEGDTLRRQGVKGGVASRIGLDSVLREQMTAEGSPYRLEDGNAGRLRSESTFEMLPPVKGILAAERAVRRRNRSGAESGRAGRAGRHRDPEYVEPRNGEYRRDPARRQYGLDLQTGGQSHEIDRRTYPGRRTGGRNGAADGQ